MKSTKAQQNVKAADRYPGVAVNRADEKDTDRKLEKQRTEILNSNPRNSK